MPVTINAAPLHTHTHTQLQLYYYWLKVSGSPICHDCWICCFFCWISCVGEKRWIESVLEYRQETRVTCSLVRLQLVSWQKAAALQGRCDKANVYGTLLEYCTIFRGLSAEMHSYKLSEIQNKYRHSLSVLQTQTGRNWPKARYFRFLPCKHKYIGGGCLEKTTGPDSPDWTHRW